MLRFLEIYNFTNRISLKIFLCFKRLTSCVILSFVFNRMEYNTTRNSCVRCEFHKDLSNPHGSYPNPSSWLDADYSAHNSSLSFSTRWLRHFPPLSANLTVLCASSFIVAAASVLKFSTRNPE